MAVDLMKEEFKYASMKHGAVYALMNGMIKTLTLYASN